MPETINQVFAIDAAGALKELNALDAGFAKLEARLNSLATTMSSANKTMSAAAKTKLGDSFDSTAKQAEKANDSIHKLTVSTGLIARILTTQLVVSFFGKFRRELADVTREAADFQREVALISTIAGGVGFDQIAESVKNLSQEFNIPLLQATAGVYQAISNQVGDFGESLEFSAKAALFAKATNSSLKDSVDLLSGAIQSFGLDASDTDRVASVFFTVIDKGRVTATELANTLGRVGPQAQSAGLSLEEVASAIASISVKGSKTAESLTQLRGLITGLIKPTPALRKELENLGFTESTSAIKTLGFAKTLDALSKSTGGSQQALATLFPNVRALSGELALSSNEFRSLIDNIKSMESQGREFAAQKALQALDTDAERVGKRINALKVELVTGLGQAALDTADKLFVLTDKLDAVESTAKNLGPAIGGISAGILGLKLQALAGAGALGTLAGSAGLLLAGGFAGNFIGQQIDDAISKNLLAATKALEAGNKAFLEDQRKLHAERLDTAKATDKAIIDSAQQTLTPLSQVYIADLNNARAANSALEDSTAQAAERMVSLRQQLINELARAASDSEQAAKDSADRIAALQARQSDRDFGNKISGLSGAQQFAALTQRAQEFAREASRLLSSAVSPEQIQKALGLFDKAFATGESAKTIAERTGNRTLELQAAAKLKGLTTDQIRAEEALENLQRRRVPGLQAEADKQRDITQRIKEQVKILQENTGAFDPDGKQFSAADLAKRAANRLAAEKQLAGLGLTSKDFTQIALLGLSDFVTKSGQQLKNSPIQLAFDVEKGSRAIEKKLTDAFSKFKLSVPFDLGDLGKRENPDQILTGLDKIKEKAAELRLQLSNAFNVTQQVQAAKGELDELFQALENQKSTTDNIGLLTGPGFASKLNTSLATVKSTFADIRADGVITPEEVAKANAVANDFKTIGQTFGLQKPALNATVLAIGSIVGKFKELRTGA